MASPFTLVLFLVTICTFSVNGDAQFGQILADGIHEFKPFVAQTVVDIFMKKLKENGIKNSTRVPIIPALPDPLPLPYVEYHFEGVDMIGGNATFSDTKITGLSTITDDLTIEGLENPIISYLFNATNIALESQYTSDILLNFTIPVTGSGEFLLSLIKPFLYLKFKLNVTPEKMFISDAVFDFGFDNLKLRAEDLIFCATAIELEWFDAHGKPIFDMLWTSIRDDVTSGLVLLINEILQSFNLKDFSHLPQHTMTKSGAETLELWATSTVHHILELMPREVCDGIVPTESPNPTEPEPDSAISFQSASIKLLLFAGIFFSIFVS